MRSILALLLIAPIFADDARDQRVREDLNFVVSSIRSRHPDPHTKISRAAFDRSVQELSDSISALSDVKAYVGIKRIVASIGDAHTTLTLNPAYAALGVQPLPIRLTLYDDGLFVSTVTAASSAYLGRRALTVNGRTAAELIEGIRPFVSFDNEQHLRQRLNDILSSPQLLNAAGLGDDPGFAELVLEDGLGRRESVRLPGTGDSLTEAVNDPSVGFLSPTYLDPSLEYWYRYYPEQRLLFVKYNACRQRSGLPFADFANSLFAELDSRPVDHLVVDLRDNPGGDSEVWRPFLNGLNSRYARLRASNPSFALYGLISRFTFSSGMFAAQEIKRFPGALLVGEGTGGNPEAFGDTVTLALPNLRTVSLSVSTRFFRPFGPGVTPPTVAPDVRVFRDSGDVFARWDPVLFAVFGAKIQPADRSGSIVSAATFRAGSVHSPGSLSSAFGDFGDVPTLTAGSLPLPVQLGGIQILAGGRLAPLLVVSPHQINFQQPQGPLAERETVVIRRNGSVVWTGTEDTAPEAPAIFTADASNFRKPGAVLNDDGSLNSKEHPARRGQLIQIFATGYSELTVPVEPGNAPDRGTLVPTRVKPRVLIGQWDMQVEFSGASPEFPGLWQINAVIPNVAAIEKLMPLAILINGRWSNAVSIWVEPEP